MFLRYRQRRHIKNKIEICEKKMWDLEFLKEKLKAMREGFRQEYDRTGEIVAALEERMKRLKERNQPGDDDEIGIAKKKADETLTDRAQLQKQMEAVDSQIEGRGEEQGINEGISGYRTVIGLLQDYLKKI